MAQMETHRIFLTIIRTWITVICSLAFLLQSTSADQIDKGPAELLPDEQKCLYENHFKFLDAYLLVRRVQPNPLIQETHEKALEKGALARYNITRVEVKTFTFSAGSKSRSIDNAVSGPPPETFAVHHD